MIAGRSMIPRALVALVLAAVMIVVGRGSATAADPAPPGSGSCQPSGGGISPQYRAVLDRRFGDLEKRILAHNAEPHAFRPAQEGAHRAYDAEAKSLNDELTDLRRQAQGALAIPSDLGATICRPPQPVPWGGVYDYYDGGRADAVQHVLYRHGYSSTLVRVSNFLPNTRPVDVQRWVDRVIRDPATRFRHEGGLDSYSIVGPAGTIVGTARSDRYGVRGPPVDHLEIWVRNGVIRTAYPVENPSPTGAAGN